jgi:hypothetical protein
MAPAMKAGQRSGSRQQHLGSQRVQYRPRDESAVRMFGLRNAMRVYVGHQQAPTPRRSRRGAGRRAWGTRIAKYGPSGRRPAGGHQMAQRAHVQQPPRTQPQIVVPTTLRPDEQQLALDEAPRLETDRRRERPTSIASRSDEPVTDGDDIPQMDDEGSVFNDLDVPTQPPPPPTPRPALAEVPLPPPSPLLPRPATTNIPTEANEMTRLLNERRARLLGPQNITQTPREPRPVGFIVFNDLPANESELDIGIDDKENEEPDWSGSGQGAPPAPGPSRLEGPVLGERPLDGMGNRQGGSGGGRRFGGFFG